MDLPETDVTCGPLQSWRNENHGVELLFERGRLHLTAEAHDILRVRFTPGEAFARERPWSVVTHQDPLPLEVTEQGRILRLATQQIVVSLHRDTGAMDFATRDGKAFGCDLTGPCWREMELQEALGLANVPDAELPAGPARLGMFLNKHMPADEAYYGFGQRTGKLNRRHRRLTHWSVDRSSPGHSRGNNNMYQVHPMFLAVRPDLAWGLFMHSTWYSAFDVGDAQPDILTLFTLGGELDYYLFAGPSPAAVVEQLTRLTGRPALPPLWSLGYHQSRWSYATDEEVQTIARELRERRMPVDAIHLDIDYMRDYRVFTWDPERFPEPAQTVQCLHEQDIRAVVIVDPGVKRDPDSGYAVHDQGVEQDHFIRNPDGSLFSGYVWPGESLFPDYCREATRRWWGDWHAGLLETGVDGVWCDMNEPAIVDRPFRTPGVKDKPIPLASPQGDDETPALHAETHNLYGQLMARATAEGLRRLRPDRRPWVLTRSAYVGVQRFAATWMGDNSSWWEHLEMSLAQVASMGLCGAPHAGVDIGGFYHNVSAELFARWMEFGTFYPFMRGHSRIGSRPQEPWAFGPAVETIAREAIELRYRLLPYLYTLAHLAHCDGAPILRPLVYDYPEQPALYEIEDQLMFGPQLMVAPVYRPGVRRRLVELPVGADWYDYWSGVRTGPGPVVQPAPLGRPPLFVPAGAILTLGNVRQSTAEPVSELFVEIFPGRDGAWTLIEDDGESFDYLNGARAETRIEIDHTAARIKVTLSERTGAYVPASRTLVLQIHLDAPPDVVLLDTTSVSDWHWQPDRRLVELRWRDDGRGHELELVREPGLSRYL